MNGVLNLRWRLVVSIAVVLLVFNVVVWAAGESPLRVIALALTGAFGSGYGIAQTLAKATPLLWTGVAVAFALEARLFNIGAEGQCVAGVLAAAVAGHTLSASTPWWIAVPVCLAAAASAGMCLGGFAGWLRGRFETHEVISTLMLNGLVAVATTWLYSGPLRVGAQVHTAPIVANARLPQAGNFIAMFHGSALNASLLLGVFAAFAARWYLRNTRGGVALRALGGAPLAAAALGVDRSRATIRAMAISGALAGLAGSHYVLGIKGYGEQGLGTGVGFTGIAVALLGAGKPWGIALAALLFGAMAQGALAINALVPSDALMVAQATVMLAVAALGAYTRTREKP
jgi:general nucleoside transport system permease protein